MLAAERAWQVGVVWGPQGLGWRRATSGLLPTACAHTGPCAAASRDPRGAGRARSRVTRPWVGSPLLHATPRRTEAEEGRGLAFNAPSPSPPLPSAAGSASFCVRVDCHLPEGPPLSGPE